MRRLHFGAAALSITAVLIACSADKPGEKLGHTVQNIQPPAGQTAAMIQDATHTFVVGVCGGGVQGGQCALTCSGALILPNVVLTARHCVQQTIDVNPSMGIKCPSSTFGSQLAPTNSYFITTSETMPVGAKKHVVKQIVTPPATELCGNDIAILILNDLVPGSEATPAIPSTGFSISDRDHYNPSSGFTAMGYGISSPTSNDSGTRRKRENVETLCIPGDGAIDCTTLGAPADELDAKEFIGGDGPCEGDSGSSAWEQDNFNNGVFISMGILSRGGVDKATNTCVQSFFTRVDSWRDLIVQTATSASGNWSLYPKPTPDWTVYVPPTNIGGSSSTKKDAGAKDSGSGSSAGTKSFGDACTANPQCTSALCSTDGVCTKSCTTADANSCPSGYSCNGSICLTVDAPAATHTTTTTSGCAMSPSLPGKDPTKPVPWRSLGLGLAVVVALRARRARQGKP